MSIASLDQVIEGMTVNQTVMPWAMKNDSGNALGRWGSYWATGGIPNAGGYDTTLNGATLTGPVLGAWPFADPPSGKRAYIVNFNVCPYIAQGPYYLVDRIWQNRPSSTDTASQSITSPAWPARDADGSTNGRGIYLGIEISTTMGAASPTATTITYTNSEGTGSRSATLLDTASMSGANASAFFRTKLASGDKGVRSVQATQLSASWLSGAWNIVAYRIVLPLLNSNSTGVGARFTAASGGFPELFTGSVLHIIKGNTSASGNPTDGWLKVTYG